VKITEAGATSTAVTATPNQKRRGPSGLEGGFDCQKSGSRVTMEGPRGTLLACYLLIVLIGVAQMHQLAILAAIGLASISLGFAVDANAKPLGFICGQGTYYCASSQSCILITKECPEKKRYPVERPTTKQRR
jgi:hypothetical protein